MKKKHIATGVLLIVTAVLVWLISATTGHPSALASHNYDQSPVRIDNVRLISMVRERPQVEERSSVLVNDGFIIAIGKTGELFTTSGIDESDLRVIDGNGSTLLPGLIDAHVHLWDEAELAAFLAHGVTSIRNLSGMPFHLPLSKRIREGEIIGPDVVTTGPILNGLGANTQDNHQIVETAEAGRNAVKDHYERGYRTLKIYSNLNRETYNAIRDEAIHLEMKMVGHTPEGVRALGVPRQSPFDIPYDEILDDGFQTLEHIETIVWHGLRDELDKEKMEALAIAIQQSGAVVTPTLIAHESLVRTAKSNGAYLRRPGVEVLNPLIQRFESGNMSFWSNAPQHLLDHESKRSAFYLHATHMLQESGVPLITGTDAGVFTIIPGSSMTRELELLVASGLTPYEALQAASVTAGPAINLPDRGQIAPGFRANMILVSGTPLKDISIMEHPEAVMVGGVWLDKNDLSEIGEAAKQGSSPRTARRLVEMWLTQ